MLLYPTLPSVSAARRATIALFLFLITSVVASAQEGEGASRQGVGGRGAGRAAREGRATVRGRVTFADTGKPVRRGVVSLLTDLNHPAVLSTPTDRRGEFRFRNVPPGKYLVTADAPGVLSRASGFSIRDTGFVIEGVERSTGRVTVGEDGEAKVEFSVERGGAITGRVTYSDGEPVTSAYLVLYARKNNELTRFFTDLARTDDRGVYRVEGLPAGEYVVGVIEKGAGGAGLLPRTEGAGLAARYHPSAASAKEAAAVRVEAGKEADDVDVRLAENELRRLAGVVRWRRTGEPARGGAVILRRRDDPGVDVSVTDFLQNITPANTDSTDTLMRDMSLFTMMSSNAPYVEVDADGRWSFSDVPPGTYLMTTMAPLPPEKPASPEGEKDRGAGGDPDASHIGRPLAQGRALVTLSATDITDLRIEMAEGARVSGTVTLDGGGPPPFGVRVSAAPPNSGGGGIESIIVPATWTNPDGTFLLEAVTPGEVALEVVLPARARHYVRSVTAGGADLTRAPLRLADGAEAAGVRIDLSSDLAKLSGRVLGAGERAPAAGALVLLVAADGRPWRSRAARVFARADAAGEFSAEAAPGDYLLFAWRPGEEPAGAAEAYVRTHAASARKVSLKPGDNPEVELLTTRPATR